MKTLRSMAVWMVSGVCLAACGIAAGAQQSQGQGQSSRTAAQSAAIAQAAAQAAANVPTANDDPSLAGTSSIEEQQARMRNSERQKQLVDDTQRLLSLANELKADVDKSTKDTLSLDVIRKADEIEKLAHNVKDRMKGS
jgi:hypothetical protein